MRKHCFLSEREISTHDIEVLIALTREGTIAWIKSDVPRAYRGVSDESVGRNISDLRIGYRPHGEWTYLRLRDDSGSFHYVERGSPEKALRLARKLYQIVRKAVRLGGSLAGGNDKRMFFCNICEKETAHTHLYDAAHGIPGLYMAGSERYVCVECETSIFLEEGGAVGLPYPFETGY